MALTAFYSEAVVKRGLPLPRAAALAAGNAAKIFGLRGKGALLPGMDADIVVMDVHRDWRYDVAKSFSRVKFTHGIYQDYLLHCRVDAAYVRGTLVYDGESITVEPGYGTFIARDNKERGII